MSAMAGKKKGTKRPLLLFVVEGDSDRIALQYPIARLLKERGLDMQVAFCKCDGDKTSDRDISPDDLLRKLDEIVDGYLERSPEYYTFEDIDAIIYLFDTDGFSIPDEDCHRHDGRHQPPIDDKNKFLYDTDGIYGPTAQAVINRNRHKAENMDKLLRSSSRTKTVRHGNTEVPHTVKRQVYYFSVNLDHFLYGVMNLDDRKKVITARLFANDQVAAINTLCDPETCVSAPLLVEEGLLSEEDADNVKAVYKASWAFLELGRNSIGRHSNLTLLLDELVKDAGEQPDGTDNA